MPLPTLLTEDQVYHVCPENKLDFVTTMNLQTWINPTVRTGFCERWNLAPVFGQRVLISLSSDPPGQVNTNLSNAFFP